MFSFLAPSTEHLTLFNIYCYTIFYEFSLRHILEQPSFDILFQFTLDLM